MYIGKLTKFYVDSEKRVIFNNKTGNYQKNKKLVLILFFKIKWFIKYTYIAFKNMVHNAKAAEK